LSDAATPADVIAFWREVGPQKWFKRDDALDSEIAARFDALHAAAATGRHDAWSETSEGALALLLLLDQFSRNLHRGSPKAFAQDAKARDIARKALGAGFDHAVEPALRRFFHLPFMHSELIADQERSVALCHQLGDAESLYYARDHERIIRRFGRFPHRNKVVGRHTSPAEQAFLEGGGFSG
jgi:uncharacterized protein (DUF924 family)